MPSPDGDHSRCAGATLQPRSWPGTWGARGNDSWSPTKSSFDVVLEADHVEVGPITAHIDDQLPRFTTNPKAKEPVLGCESPQQVCCELQVLGFGASHQDHRLLRDDAPAQPRLSLAPSASS